MGNDSNNSDLRGSDHDLLLNIVETFFSDTRDKERQKFKKEAYETWLESRQRKQILRDAEVEELKRIKEKWCAVVDRQIKRLEMGIE